VKPPVQNKTDFVRRYLAGEFGNRSPNWDTYQEYWDSGYDGLACIRNRVAGSRTYYKIPRDEMPQLVNRLIRGGEKAENLYYSAMCPDEFTILQGEVYRSDTGLRLFYSQLASTPMKIALAKDGREARGLMALGLIRGSMNQRSSDWLDYLLNEYEDHVVEFTVLSKCWGTEPGYNTLFWECRRGY
jgi:hypothetical protein